MKGATTESSFQKIVFVSESSPQEATAKAEAIKSVVEIAGVEPHNAVLLLTGSNWNLEVTDHPSIQSIPFGEVIDRNSLRKYLPLGHLAKFLKW